jgi:beta-lactamase superfamily II metal-dependent hydrolase
MITVEIYNVNHGQCAVVTAPNGRRIMVDCGDRFEGGKWWAPSMQYCGQYIDLLALLNLDEDHLSNFSLLKEYVRLGAILTNPTVTASGLRLLKPNGMGRGTQSVETWMADPFKPSVPLPDFGGLRIWWYFNAFNPFRVGAAETNDLSLVLLIQYGAFKIVFSGDMEIAGWRELLANFPQLRIDLAGTSVFVASHHGRVSGCSTELFDVFRPELIMISDTAKQYDSQDTDDWYRRRCIGVPVIGRPGEWRYVMTTRSDGSMKIDVAPNGRWVVDALPVPEWDLSRYAA